MRVLIEGRVRKPAADIARKDYRDYFDPAITWSTSHRLQLPTWHRTFNFTGLEVVRGSTIVQRRIQLRFGHLKAGRNIIEDGAEAIGHHQVSGIYN